jgi:hypothetical protein
MPFIDLGIFGLSHRLVSGDYFDVKSVSLLAQFDKPRITINKAALLVGDVFRGFRVAFSIYLRDCIIELGLLRSV